MPSKRRLAQLHNARLARKKAKKQKVKQSLSSAQSCNKSPRTDTIDLNDSEYVTWFWNMSAHKSKSESDKGGQLDKDEPDFESRTEVAKEIRWDKKGENKLRGIYGGGRICIVS